MAVKLTDAFLKDSFNPDMVGIIVAPQKAYKEIVIDGVTWMAENLRETHYANGDPIPCLTFDDAAWIADTTGACTGYIPNSDTEYEDDEIAYELTYGLLYNWHAVNNAAGLAPDGWHIPTNTEWWALINYLDGLSLDTGAALAGNAYLWALCSGPAAGNLVDSAGFGKTGFNALPAGLRVSGNGVYTNIIQTGLFWTATEYDSANAYIHTIWCVLEDVWSYHELKGYGFSVRCVKD